VPASTRPRKNDAVLVRFSPYDFIFFNFYKRNTMAKKSTALIAVALAVGAAVALYLSNQTQMHDSSPGGKAGKRNSNLVEESARNDAPPKQPPQKSTPLSYESAKDLKAYLGQLEASGAKQPEVALSRARAIEECSPFTRMPNFAFDTVKARQGQGSGDAVVQQNYARIYTERCASLAMSGPLKLADSKQFYQDSAQGGNFQAQAHLIANQLVRLGDTTPSGELMSKVNDLIATQDASAISELSDSFGTNSKFTGPYFGNEKTAAAWRLVACDLGLDCAESSSLLIGFCLNGGIYCGPGDLRYNMRQYGFSPTDFEEVASLEQKIYSRLKDSKGSFIQP